MAESKLIGSAPGERQKFWFQFVTTSTADTPGTTLILHFDNRRYFFGRMAEGTQRACIERGVGIKKVRNFFLTGRTTWRDMGGLIGMILTLADVQALEVESGDTTKRPTLHIHGGPKLTHAMACARRFVFRKSMPLAIHEAIVENIKSLEQPTYTDENINVWSLPIRPRGRGAISPRPAGGRSASPATVNREQDLRSKTVHDMFDSDWNKDKLIESRFDEVKLPAMIFVRDPETKELSHFHCTTMADAAHLSPESRVLVRNPWPASLVPILPAADNLPSSVAMSYIVRGHPQRGTFQPKKAKELGVEPGPDYGILASGGNLILKDGRVITPEMVLSAPEPGHGMAIFDIPEQTYVEALSDHIEQLKSGPMNGVGAATWILGPGVLHSAEMRGLFSSMSDLKHVISSPETNSNYIALDSSTASSIRLNQIRPECFALPVGDNQPKLSSGLNGLENMASKLEIAERGLKVQVQPKSVVVSNEVPELINIEAIQSSCSTSLSHLIPAPSDKIGDNPYDQIEIVTLGTGSAVPSKYRNVSATMVRIPGLGNYLFDCGENTVGQLRRLYPERKLDEILCDTRMLWISHLHADHHLGTLSFIVARDEAMRRLGRASSKLYIISEPNMADYLTDYRSVEGSDNCVLVACYNSRLTIYGDTVSITGCPLAIKKFASTKVSHCHGAQAVSVTFDNGFKFSYSGDCRPSAEFARIGMNSDVLLHEATFDDGMEGDAFAKKHSTTGEALGVAVAMRAKNVVLTHFSQRYQKIPVLDNIKLADQTNFEEVDDDAVEGPVDEGTTAVAEPLPAEAKPSAAPAKQNGESSSQSKLTQVASEMNVCVAFDLMRVKVHQIRDMHKYYPAIERMFEIEQEKSDSKKEANVQIKAQSMYEKINRGKTSSGKNKNANKNGTDVVDGGGKANGSTNAAILQTQSSPTDKSSNMKPTPSSPLSTKKNKTHSRKRTLDSHEHKASHTPSSTSNTTTITTTSSLDSTLQGALDSQTKLSNHDNSPRQNRESNPSSASTYQQQLNPSSSNNNLNQTPQPHLDDNITPNVQMSSINNNNNEEEQESSSKKARLDSSS